MMGNTTGHYNEGYAHPDSKHKIITVLVGFTREWPYERGRLRVLRSNDRDDYAFEFAPEFGRMLMFRVVRAFLPRLPAAEGPAHEPAALLRRFRGLRAQGVLCGTASAPTPSRCRCCAS